MVDGIGSAVPRGLGAEDQGRITSGSESPSSGVRTAAKNRYENSIQKSEPANLLAIGGIACGTHNSPISSSRVLLVSFLRKLEAPMCVDGVHSMPKDPVRETSEQRGKRRHGKSTQREIRLEGEDKFTRSQRFTAGRRRWLCRNLFLASLRRPFHIENKAQQISSGR